MCFELDDITFVVEYAMTGKDLDLGWFRMDKGTHVACAAAGKARSRAARSSATG